MKRLSQKPKTPNPQIILPVMWRPPKRLRNSTKRDFKKRNANKRILALVPLPLKIIQLLTIQGLKDLKKTSLGLHISTAIKRAIMLEVVPNPKRTILKKTSCNLDDLYIDDWG